MKNFSLTPPSKIRFLNTIVFSLCALLSNPLTIYANEDVLCKPRPVTDTKVLFSNDGKTHLRADNVEVKEEDISYFSGDVVIQQPNKRIESDRAKYIKQTENVFVDGNVKLIMPEIKINSESAKVNLKTDEALLQKTEYQSTNSRARGLAKSIELTNDDISILTDASYTTCDADKVDWELKAETIYLDNETRQGSASHAVLRFKNLPIFYFPYLRFSLGTERLSGFLFPYIGNSEINGFELKLPYYWNIHPQADATITPWYMAQRGVLLHTEFRYLTENSNGTLISESLNNDKIFNQDRQRWHWLHESNPGLGWKAKVEYNYVADNQHLIDFNDSLTTSSATYLVRAGDVSYNTTNWLLALRAEDHQILSGAKPYKRLPQVTLNSRYPTTNNALNYTFQSEAVRFEHEEEKVIGQRVYLKPSALFPMQTEAGFLTPKVSLHYTEYNLEQTTNKTKLSRSVPTFSINSGLFFERDSEIFNTDYLHTLEPQLFYLYAPYEDQSNFPVFDTSNHTFNINQFFADYRFNGIDRIGDDNRLTTALATRLINQNNGKEFLMARIGQIYYFSDRKVQLSNSIDTSISSHIITELKVKPNNWEFLSQIEWDSEFEERLISNNQLGYSYKGLSLNLAQRYQINSLETREIKANWALNSRWQFIYSNLYDIRNENILENLFAINYESCCWGLSLSSKERYLTEETTERSFYLTMTLKGLSSFGLTRKYTHFN